MFAFFVMSEKIMPEPWNSLVSTYKKIGGNVYQRMGYDPGYWRAQGLSRDLRSPSALFCLLGNEFEVMLRGEGPHKPEFAYDLVRIHFLMIYTDLIEYNIVGDTKAPLLHCFPFISKLKPGDILTTAQYKNYQTFSNLQFGSLLRNSFHIIHIDLGDTSVEKIPFVTVGITRFVLMLMFKKASNIQF